MASPPPSCTCTGPARPAHDIGCPVRIAHPRVDLGDNPRPTCRHCGKERSEHWDGYIMAHDVALPQPGLHCPWDDATPTKWEFDEGPTYDELLRILGVVMRSAHPHPAEHPTMTKAWDQARRVLGSALVQRLRV